MSHQDLMQSLSIPMNTCQYANRLVPGVYFLLSICIIYNSIFLCTSCYWHPTKYTPARSDLYQLSFHAVKNWSEGCHDTRQTFCCMLDIQSFEIAGNFLSLISVLYYQKSLKQLSRMSWWMHTFQVSGVKKIWLGSHFKLMLSLSPITTACISSKWPSVFVWHGTEKNHV